MTTQEIANKLVDYCRKGEWQSCYEELYSPDCESVEPKGAMTSYAKGMEEIAKKGQAWQDSIKEFHGSEVGDPIVSDDHFACTMMTDITFKDENWGRMKMNEICLYHVKDGKIVREEFFYKMG